MPALSKRLGMKWHAEMDCYSSYHQGPANIAMVANNCPNGPLAIQAPPGHVVQRVDENGVVTQYHLLRAQHPGLTLNQGHASQMPPSLYPYNASNSQSMSMSGGGHHQPYSYSGQRGSPSGPGYPQGSQQPLPGYLPQYHHHIRPHPIIGDGPNGTHAGLSEDRTHARPAQSRRDKNGHSQHRPKNPDLLMQSCYNHSVPPRLKMNGGSPRGSDRPLDLSSCSSSTDSHDTTEDEKRQLVERLSAISPPQVGQVLSRVAAVQIITPDIPDNLIPLEQPINTCLQFQLQYADRKDSQYTTVYEGDATTITVKDLKPATEYYVRLCAIIGDSTGNYTDPVRFETPPAPPEAPLPPKLGSKARTFVNLKWNAVTDNGSKVLNYIVEYYEGQPPAKEYTECYRGLKKEFKVTKLQPSQRYTFRLAAVNSFGQSEYSKELTVFTNGTAPSQPEPPLLSESSLTTLLLTWIKRPVDKEFVLQKEEEDTGHGFLAAYSGPEVSYKVDCLRKSTAYKFRLQAVNDDGKSNWSQVVKYKTRADVPAAPTQLSAKGKILGNSFRLFWEAPREDGGSEVQSFLAQLDEGKGYQSVYDGLSCECSCSNLLPGHKYKARVAARNSIGLSRWSETTQVTTKAILPGPCVKPHLLGKAKAHTLVLKWASPEHTGGSSIRHYVVQLVMMDNTTREVYRGHATECTVAGLSPGRIYLLQVRAANEVGEGDWSEPLEVISGAGSPEPPMAPVCHPKSAHSILISWKTPCNNGAEISEYRLECMQPHVQDYTCVFTGRVLDHEVKSLLPNTEYKFRVQAINSSGASPYSESSSAITLPSSPAAVHHIRITTAATSIAVSWDEPNNNGSEILHYNVDYGKNQTLTVTDVMERACVITGLESDTVYRIRVQAVNAVGAGVFSSQVKTTTLTLPPAPPHLECTGSTWNSIKLKWTEVDKCDQYTVLMYRNQSASPTLVYQGALQQYRVARLHEHTDYQFTISAENSAGEGPESEPLTVRTCRAPPHSLKAPGVEKVAEKECEVSWQAAKPFAGDSIEYRLQLSQQGGSGDYKQVVQTRLTQHQLTGLTPGATYTVRVCAVRICSDDSDAIIGAYSPGTSFRMQKATPIVTPVRSAETPSRQSVFKSMIERTLNRLKPGEEKQLPIVLLFLLFVCSLFMALVLHYYIG
ncbi:fibronectin type-III domain-containing protein 3a-like isoform X2 [Watersipora subatra]|uniref:fibronectin type-III domain-containing protein 3a-like isoform X2 n=1 Tax=Watersipora subatra TaxID=2589382 RepID=UPI00355AFDF8